MYVNKFVEGTNDLAVLEIIFNFILGPPLPRGVPGEGPDCNCSREIVGVGPIPARIRGVLILIWL